MKTTYENPKPWIVNYRNYKKFCNDTFRQILLEKLSTENINANSRVSEIVWKNKISRRGRDNWCGSGKYRKFKYIFLKCS